MRRTQTLTFVYLAFLLHPSISRPVNSINPERKRIPRHFRSSSSRKEIEAMSGIPKFSISFGNACRRIVEYFSRNKTASFFRTTNYHNCLLTTSDSMSGDGPSAVPWKCATKWSWTGDNSGRSVGTGFSDRALRWISTRRKVGEVSAQVSVCLLVNELGKIWICPSV